MDKSLGDSDTLLHPSRESADASFGVAEQIDLVELLHDLFAVGILSGEDKHVFKELNRVQVRVEAELLRDDRDALAHLIDFPVAIVTRHPGCPRCGFECSGKYADERGLARAVGTQKPVHAAWNSQVYAIERSFLTVEFCQIFCLDHGRLLSLTGI